MNRRGVDTKQLTTEEIIDKALKQDELAVKDLQGNLNTLDDLFNQVKGELDDIIFRMEQSKRGKTENQKAEIDEKIEQFKKYTENIKNGIYTLALSKSEQNKVIRDLLAEKYFKTVTVNGAKKNVLDWNKLLASENLENDIREILRKKGYDENQIDKVYNAIQYRLNEIKRTSQWNNSLKAREKKMLDDEAFLDRATATVAMSKTDDKGKPYKKYNSVTDKEEPDWDRFQKDTGKTMQDLKNEIRAVFQNTPKVSADEYIKSQKDKNGKYYVTPDGNPAWDRYAKDKWITIEEAKSKIEDKVSVSASQYRQIISELERKNNPAKHVSKSDLERLAELAERRGFDSLFNAKAYSILGLSDKDTEAGKLIQDLTETAKKILTEGGDNQKIALGKVLDNINSISEYAQNDKSRLLRLSRMMDWYFTNRNAYRILSIYNVFENTFSGISQAISSTLQTDNKKVVKEEIQKMFDVFGDVATGGRHFDMTNVDKISFTGHEYRFDEKKSLSHNIKAALSVLPNVALGAMDSAVHSYTMRTMFYNVAVKTYKSKLIKDRIAELAKSGYSEKEAKDLVKKEDKDLQNKAIDNVFNALYTPQKGEEEEALMAKAERILKLATPNPTQLEIKREAANLELERIVTAGLINKSQFNALIKASDVSAKKALGKEAAVNFYVNKGLSAMQMKFRENIKNSIQKKQYTKAAFQTASNAIIMKGLLPFMAAGVNWGIITGKKTGLGLLRAYSLNKQSFRQELEDAANANEKQLFEVMEAYNSRRNDVYYGLQGAIFFAIAGISLAAAYAATPDDEKEGFIDWVNELMKQKLFNNPVEAKMAQRWLPPSIHLYNIIEGNVKGNQWDVGANFFGGQAMESPLGKASQFVSPKHKTAGLGRLIGSALESPSVYYNAMNSWVDAIYGLTGEVQDNKVKAHSVASAMGSESDLINGFMAGFFGYNLNQDINNWTDFEPRK